MLGFYRVNQLINACHALEIRIQAIHEQGVKHVSGDLRKTRERLSPVRRRRLVRGFVSNANHQNPVCAKVNCRAQWCRLAHRTVSEVLAIDLYRRKYHRHRDTGHQVIEIQIAADADAASTGPARPIGCRLKK